MDERRVIDLRAVYGEQAKLAELPAYLERVKALAGEGNEIVLTGQAPVWLYLKVAHALHNPVPVNGFGGCGSNGEPRSEGGETW